MYKVYFDEELAYLAGDKELVLLNPVVELEVNKAGSFLFDIPVINPFCERIKELVTVVRVNKSGQDIFIGRCIDIVVDFYGTKSVTCEGELAYLLDSIQPPGEYHNVTVRGFLRTLLENHNSQVASDKSFEVGMVTVQDSNDSLYRYTNWENTLEDLRDKLVSRLGGYLRVRHSGNVRYLDYIEAYTHITEQVIEFGSNLLDYSQTIDATDIATAVIPLGAKQDESDITALEAYLTIESVNGGKN